LKYLITGGGTGGHIYPALAIAEEIKSRDQNAEILYVGTKNGLEAELVSRAGFKFRTIRVKGMPRKINRESFIAFKELLHGLFESNKIIKEFKPDIVVGTGGYVSGPVVYMAKKRGISAIIHEQNAYPGITNKILSRYVDKVAATFDESKKYFKYPERVHITGNPIRKEIGQIKKEDAYRDLAIESKNPFILSFGGSGGQKKLNDAIFNLIKDISTNKREIQLIHVTGKRLYDDFIRKLDESKIILDKNIKVYPYFYQMPQALNIASLVITSAGAITLAELAAVGVPSILIPKSYTAENHQEYNARVFEQEGASILVLEKDINDEYLNSIIYDIVYDSRKLSQMRENCKKLGKKEASENIYSLLKSLASK